MSFEENFLKLANEIPPWCREVPLQGLSGIFEQTLDKRERVVILLEAIRYQARVLIEKRYLKAQAEAV